MHNCVNNIELERRAQKLTGENLKVDWDEFSTLSLTVFIMSVIVWSRQARPHLELKPRHGFCPISLNLFESQVFKIFGKPQFFKVAQ